MHPVLFKVSDFEVRSYGVLLMIGILLAVWWSAARAPRLGIDKGRILDAMLWGIIPGILGARLGFIVQEWEYYAANPDKLWTFRFEGLTSFGGVIMALLGLLWYTRRAKVDAWAFLDVVSLPLLVAHVVGRIGCLLNGCCYGRPTTEWYGVHISETIETLFQPAQVFEGLLVMFGVGVLMLVERRQPRPGTMISLSVIVWGLARFIYEFFRAGTVEEVQRGVASSTYWGSMPITQGHAAALAMVVAGVVMLLFVRKRRLQEAVA